MRLPWLVLAQLVLLPGCFDSHGMPFTGDAPAIDAGACVALPGVVSELRCEVRGDIGHAILSTSPTWCCGSGTPTTSVSAIGTSTGTSFDVGVEWSACDCCMACRCIGPIQEVDVSLGVLSPGRHTVSAGGLSCVIDHFPPGPTCRPGPADEARFPRYLYDDQPFAATVVAPSFSCSCSPRLDSPESLDLASISLCDCCDACDCIDLGYEVSVELGPLPLGPHPVVVPHGASSVTVVTRAETHPIPVATSVRIVPPSTELRSSGPPIHWAVVGGMETVCCVEPAPVIERGIGTAGEIVLSVASANTTDCECLGRPTPYEAWFPLVSLASGSYVIRAGSATATFSVP